MDSSHPNYTRTSLFGQASRGVCCFIIQYLIYCVCWFVYFNCEGVLESAEEGEGVGDIGSDGDSICECHALDADGFFD